LQYLIDANVLVAAYIKPDEKRPKYQQERVEYLEAKAAIKELAAQKQTLYYSDKALKEVEDVGVRKIGLLPEQAKQLVEDIKKDNSLLHIDQKTEREAEKKAEQIAEAQRLTEIEKQSLKETIKEERNKELAAKEAQERANARKTIADSARQARNEGASRKEVKEIIRAKTDVDHVATAKTHSLSVLTNNDKHFRIHEDLIVKRPKDVVYGMKPEEIKNVTVVDNPYTKREEYKNTNLGVVETKSGHKAELLVPAKHNDAKDIAKNIAPFNRAEIDKWKPGDMPVIAKLPDFKVLELENTLAKSTTQAAETLAKATVTATEKVVDVGAKIADKTLQTAVQVPLKTTSKAVETAAKLTTVPLKAAGKAVETVASVTPTVAKAAIQVVAVPIKAVSTGIDAVSKTVKGIKIVGKGIKDELQGKRKEEPVPQPPPPTPKQSR